TVTNNKALISYLQKNQMKSREYFFRNGVYSLRHVEDFDSILIKDWKKRTPITVQLEIPIEHNLPSEFMLCFYWIEVGKATVQDNKMTLDVYEKDLIRMIDIGVSIDLIIEQIKKVDQR
ncbi:MAG: hypothetical protein PHY08_13460, partial [Candidatus Cloacimonetes bacterium]|nr:hypothetical protein [Candidatus Cloacimonadota bacterium]